MNTVRQTPTLDRPAIYQIKVPGRLNETWYDWVGETIVTVEHQIDGPPVTILTGTIDQAGLHGLLRRLYTQGLPLISAVCIDYD
jgi:hypothetical protein